MGKQRRTRPRPPEGGGGDASSSGFDDGASSAAATVAAAGPVLPTTITATKAAPADDDTSTTGPRSSTSSSSSSGGSSSSSDALRPPLEEPPSAPPPLPFWPALIPGALFCFQLFGFQPILGQLLNQLECDRLGATDCDSAEVNGAAVLLLKYVLTLEFSCATLTLGTVGALCDYVGRKPAMIMTTLGQVVNLIAVLVALWTPYQPAIALIMVGTALNGLTGSYGTYLTGIYAYAADVTKRDPACRGRVFGKVLGAIAIGNTLGPLVSGLVLKATGSYAIPLVMQLAICLLILALLGCWLQESLDPGDKPREPFNLWRTHNTFAVLYQFLLTYRHESQRAGGGRGRGGAIPPLLPLSIVFCLCFSDLVGQGTMFLYYAKRVFHWSPDTLGYYESCIGLSKGVVMLLLLPLVYRYALKGRPPNDYLFATAGIALGMVYFGMLALLPYPAAAFAAIPFSGLSQGAYPHLRSLFSQSVEQAAQGQLFAFMSAMETLMTAVTPLILNTVYGATVESYPGFVWLILVLYLILAEAALYWAWYLARKERGEGALAEPLLLEKGEGEGEGKHQKEGDEEAGGAVRVRTSEQ